MLGYWGELAERGGLDVVRELGLAGAGGDLFCDGAFGSHTAALGAPYTDRPDTAGACASTPRQLVHHVRACTQAGIQAGFHVHRRRRGRARCSTPSGRSPTSSGVPRCGPAGTGSSTWRWSTTPTSPGCATWGWSPACSRPSTRPGAGTPACTPSGSGAERALATNPFADLADAGVALALGWDAPVTPLDPWGAVRAAVDHRTAGSGLRPFDAFDAATHGGWYAARAEHPGGPLAVGAPASLALWATSQTLSAVLDRARRPAGCSSSTGHLIGDPDDRPSPGKGRHNLPSHPIRR